MKTFFLHLPFSKLLLGMGVVLMVIGVSILGGWRLYERTLPSSTATSTPDGTTPAVLHTYLEVLTSCNYDFEGEACVNMRSGAGLEYPVIKQLRNGMVFKVASTSVVDGRTWYKIGFEGEVHYPERVVGGWYVAAEYVHTFQDEGLVATTTGVNTKSTKRIVIDLSQHVLYAYDGDTLFLKQPVSTGLELTPTPKGTFSVYRKLPDSYMQGPIAGLSDQYYDLPGVPWDLYFTQDGGAIHGAYWHNHFGEVWSHGCVNLPPDQAKILYAWADLGTPVTVQR